MRQKKASMPQIIKISANSVVMEEDPDQDLISPFEMSVKGKATIPPTKS